MGQARHCKKRGDDLHILQLAKISLLTSWSSSSYNSHMKLGRWRVHTARVCPHLSSPVCDEGGARAKANTKVHSKPAITWVLSLVCPPKCQAHIEHRYTYIREVYTTYICGELCSKSCNFTAQFSSTNKCTMCSRNHIKRFTVLVKHLRVYQSNSDFKHNDCENPPNKHAVQFLLIIIKPNIPNTVSV